jgi:LuxR family maltose regulon positive regulatory protein
MPQALVTTKLRAPRLRPNLVARPRLGEALAAGEGRILTLVSAPAGFGKTTLLGAWAEGWSARGGSVAWVSLEESDNDPARFLTYLVGALRSVEPCFGEGILASLRSPGFPPVEALATALVNELADLPQEIVLVLDDYHEISAGPIHALVSFLLEHLPENAHIVISGRADPPLPLPKLRARGQIAELRAAELRFTTEEAAAFLNDAMGLELSADDVAALEGVTEGWVAALQLAALTMQDRGDVSGFLEAFSGSNRHVLDFLSEEVLAHQPEDVRRFLLDTAVLERMSASLCDALTGRTDGQEMLERLERENLFVVALDDERRWYRYHHLFADFLRSRLERESPERLVEAHRRASDWYERGRWPTEAIGHALASQDHELAVRLVERHMGEVLERSEGATFDRWLEAIPITLVRSRPRLCLARAYRAMVGGRPDVLEPLLEDTERAFAASDGPDESAAAESTQTGWLANIPGAVAVLRADIARLRGDADGTTWLAQQALGHLSAEDRLLRSLAEWNLARARWMRGELVEAERALADIFAAWRVVEERYLALIACWDLGRVQSARGCLRTALHTYRQGLALEVESESPPAAAAVGIAQVGLAEVLREQDELDAALRHATEGIERCKQLASPQPQAAGLVTLARIRQARGDLVGALEAVGEAERFGPGPEVIHLFNPVPVEKARLLLVGGEVAQAARWTAERGLGVEDDLGYVREPEHLILARVLIAGHEPEQALRLLDRLLSVAELSERMGSVIEILALQALALWACDEKEQAVNTLGQALFLGESKGYVRTFVDEGPEMAALISEVLELRQRGRMRPSDHVPARYLAKLMAAFEQEVAKPATAKQLVEPLSERELEVLALIAAGESNREIAGRLFVSTSTVKTHVNNLFRKLSARNRTQAVARAREMNLL